MIEFIIFIFYFNAISFFINFGNLGKSIIRHVKVETGERYRQVS